MPAHSRTIVAFATKFSLSRIACWIEGKSQFAWTLIWFAKLGELLINPIAAGLKEPASECMAVLRLPQVFLNSLVSTGQTCFAPPRTEVKIIMTLANATSLIEGCAEQMNAHYGKPVFDEWIIVSMLEKKEKVLAYIGPRKDHFQKSFVTDVGALRSELASVEHGFGDFEFARFARGTRFDAFMVLGEGLYLICNNTSRSMNMITKNPLWLGAQVPFVELSDKFRSNPLIYPL